MEGRGRGCASTLLHLGAPCHFCTTAVPVAVDVVMTLPSIVSVLVRFGKQAAFLGEGAPLEAQEVPPSLTLRPLLLSLALLSWALKTHLPRTAAFSGMGKGTVLNLQKDQGSWPGQTRQISCLLTIMPRSQTHFFIKGWKSTFQS